MDIENYEYKYADFPKERKEVQILISEFHKFIVFSNMNDNTSIQRFFEFAQEFEKEIRDVERVRTIEFISNVLEIEEILIKFEEEKFQHPTLPHIKNTFNSYCKKFKLNIDEPYEDERDFEKAMFELKFGNGNINDLEEFL